VPVGAQVGVDVASAGGISVRVRVAVAGIVADVRVGLGDWPAVGSLGVRDGTVAIGIAGGPLDPPPQPVHTSPSETAMPITQASLVCRIIRTRIATLLFRACSLWASRPRDKDGSSLLNSQPLAGDLKTALCVAQQPHGSAH
jgi:hypothetical protein